jgi:pyridoxamine 5'-phosphate oxidase
MSDRSDPIEYFNDLQARAGRKGEAENGSACALATSTPDGRPSARMVLVKTADANGFVFYTNYTSRKAEELDANPHAALAFHWASMAVQVRVEGSVERATEAESDAYFASRARQSQLGAWASLQSQPMSGRRDLIGRYLQEKARRIGRTVPRPPHWGGYRLAPERIEFWVGKLGRLHDRYLYTLDDDGRWQRQMLYP